MTENYKEPVEIKITQEQLVDYLFHAATREDIAALRKENKEDLNNLETRLRGEINGVRGEVNALEIRMSTQFKWVLGTTIGVGVSICGVMIGLASFLTHYIQH